ncbi:fimbrial protein [Erwinia sp. AnSW2-5]|uniref:fimbrial protein n=1 Tax=Erwinia sp. AnSW2-5 TaxID=3367692 RepID=UPI00385CCCB5
MKIFIVILSLFGASPYAYAELICRAADGRNTLLSLGVDTPAIKVTPGIPLGTVLFSKTFEFTTSCSQNKLTDKGNLIYFKRKNITNSLGYGLTLSVGFNGKDGSIAQNIPTNIMIKDVTAVGGGSTSSYWPKNTFSVDVKITKTSNSSVPGVVVKSVDLFTMGGASSYPADTAAFNMQNPNNIVYTTETCKVSGPASFSVVLDKAILNKLNGFGSGIGTNTKPKDFSIMLICDTDIMSTFKIMMQLDGTSPAGGKNSGLLSLSPNADNASGVALQILKGGSGVPVNFGTSWQIGSFPVSGSKITIPLTARYYQTEKNITPGIANSTMIYTISYM